MDLSQMDGMVDSAFSEFTEKVTASVIEEFGSELEPCNDEAQRC